MNEDNLTGRKVKNIKYGLGTIVNFNKYYLSVCFSTCTLNYFYPLCFNNKSLELIPDLPCSSEMLLEEEIKNEITELSVHEIKLNMLVDKVLKNDSISLDLIAIFDDDDFETFAFKRCFEILTPRIINSSNENYSIFDRGIVIVSLTLLALKYYEAGNLESFIYKKFIEFNPQILNLEEIVSKEVMIQKGLYKTIKNSDGSFDYRKITLYRDRTSFVAVPLILSVVPHCKMKDLFKFAQDIYKKKLLFSEDISDEEMSRKIEETLNDLKEQKYITSKYDESIIGDYMLCAYTKCCIYTGKCREELVEIILKCIKLIIYSLTLPFDAFDVPPFYKEGFEKWHNSFDEKNEFEENVILSRPSLVLTSSKNIILKTGKVCIDSRYDPNDIELIIYSNGNLVFRKHIDGPNDIEYKYKNDIVGGYVINRINSLLPCSPIEKISYAFAVGDEIVYFSKELLFRDNIFFDERGEEIKPGTQYNGELKVITKNLQTSHYFGLELLQECNNYFIYRAVVDSENSFIFDNNSYVFYKIEKPEILGYSVPWAYIECEGRKYKLYKDHSFIFRVPNQIEDICYCIDGVYFDAKDNDWNHHLGIYSKEHNNYNTYIIKLFKLSPGLHSLKVISRKDNSVIKGCSFSFVCDSDFERRIESSEKGNYYTYRSAFLKNDVMIYYEYGCTSKLLDIFVPQLGYCKLHITPSDFSYSQNENDWFSCKTEIFLNENFTLINKISICGPSETKAYYLDGNNNICYLNLNVYPHNPNLYSFYLTQIKQFGVSGSKETKVYFETGNKHKFLLFRHVPRINRDETQFVYDEINRKICFRICLVGFDYCWTKIYDSNNQEIVILSRKIKSCEDIEILEQNIPTNVNALTISLYMFETYSLLPKPYDMPFKTFERYYLPSKIVAFNDIDRPCEHWIDEECKFLYIRTSFSGPETVRLIVVPRGKIFANYIIFDKEVKSDETCKIEIDKLPFESYFVRILNSGDTLNSRWLHHFIVESGRNLIGKHFKVEIIRDFVKKLYPSNQKIILRKISLIYDNALFVADVYKNQFKQPNAYLFDIVYVDENYINFRLCGIITDHGYGIPMPKPGNEIFIVRRNDDEKSN